MRGVKEQIKVNREEEKKRMMEEKRTTDEHKRIMNPALPAITEGGSEMSRSYASLQSGTTGNRGRPSSGSSINTTNRGLPGTFSASLLNGSAVNSRTSLMSASQSSGFSKAGTSSLPKISMSAPLGQADHSHVTGAAKKKKKHKKKGGH